MANIPNLDDLANFYHTDKGTLFETPCKHGYAPIYDELLMPMRDQTISMLEVGVWLETSSVGGESLEMWRKYFQHALIYAFDIRDMYNHPFFKNNPNVFFYRGDQGDRNDFVEMHKNFNNTLFDLILEDGSHKPNHQMISLGHLFQYVKPEGIYILEDITIPGIKNCNGMNNDETWYTLNNFILTNKMVSKYLNENEIIYLEEHIKSITLYEDIKKQWMTAIIRKK